jgi:hypothetical protein
VLVAIGVFFSSRGHGAARPLELGGFRDAHIVEVRDAAGRTVLSGELRSRTDTRLPARLRPPRLEIPISPT